MVCVVPCSGVGFIAQVAGGEIERPNLDGAKKNTGRDEEKKGQGVWTTRDFAPA